MRPVHRLIATVAALTATIAVLPLGGTAQAAPQPDSPSGAAAIATPAATYTAADREGLSTGKLTIRSVIGLDLRRDFARLPLHRATVNGQSVWYVVTDVSDRALATRYGLNFAPRLANLVTPDCPQCVQTVDSPPAGGVPAFRGQPDFSPTRVVVPGPDGGFPPSFTQPGAVAGEGYSPYVHVAGTDIVYDAPVVAVGDGPFDVTTHANTHDRLLAIDTQRMTADLGFVRAFSNGEDIFYLQFDTSNSETAAIERGTFSPGLGLSPSPDLNRDPTMASAAIFSVTNGKTGPTSPPAQGLDHVIIDGLNPLDLNLANTQLLAALRVGGDAHNILDVFPTLLDRELRELYTPDWDLHLGVWSDAAVNEGRNGAREDANVLRQAAARGLVTSPGGTLLRSDRSVLNCPALGWEDEAPTEPQAPKPPQIP